MKEILTLILYCKVLVVTNLVNKIKIYTNLIKIFHFEIYSILYEQNAILKGIIIFKFFKEEQNF